MWLTKCRFFPSSYKTRTVRKVTKHLGNVMTQTKIKFVFHNFELSMFIKPCVKRFVLKYGRETVQLMAWTWPPMLYHLMSFSVNNSNTTFPQTTLAEEVNPLTIATFAPPIRCTAFHIDLSGTSRDCLLLLTEAAWQRTSWKAGANSAALLEQNITGGSSR